MHKALFSINPEYVKKILSGEKKFEYRKISCKSPIDIMVIYETYPTCAIVGEVTVKEVLGEDKEKLWVKTSNYSGIDKAFFDSYFKNKEKAYAYSLSNPILYDKKVKLSDLNIKAAPQSFIYLSSEQYDKIHHFCK